MINIDINLKEIRQQRAEGLSAALEIKGYIPSKAVISTEQYLYQQTKYRRLFIVNSISAEMLEKLRALSTFNSRTVNYSRGAAVHELRRNIIPLTDQLIYDEKYPNKFTTSADERSSWLAILSAEEPTEVYTSLNVPITVVKVTVTHLRNCNDLPAQSCDGYELLQ